jgi:solute carrier family 25 (mitochondrial carnitine/acylcarnitine transporter), member 20/29
MVMDSILMGSLTFYRKILNEHLFNRDPSSVSVDRGVSKNLPALGHAMAGVMAGCTVSFVAAPVEHVKARLQVQYQADKSKRTYSGPIDCTKKLVSLPSIFTLPVVDSSFSSVDMV